MARLQCWPVHCENASDWGDFQSSFGWHNISPKSYALFNLKDKFQNLDIFILASLICSLICCCFLFGWIFQILSRACPSHIAQIIFCLKNVNPQNCFLDHLEQFSCIMKCSWQLNTFSHNFHFCNYCKEKKSILITEILKILDIIYILKYLCHISIVCIAFNICWFKSKVKYHSHLFTLMH